MKEEGEEKHLVNGSGLSDIPVTYTVCSPQRETQTVQHAAERRDDGKRERRQTGETMGGEGGDDAGERDVRGER